MSTQHSPAPWVAVDCPHDYSIQEIKDAEGNIVAIAVREKHDEDSTETAVNATLLAAAPELLAALQSVKELAESDEDDATNLLDRIYLKAIAAIEKATNH